MGLGVLNPKLVTGVQNNATAISKGQAVVLNSTTDGTKVVVATADNQAAVLGLAAEDSPGQNRHFNVAVGGVAYAKADGAITQGDLVMTSATGGRVKTIGAVAGTNYNVIGKALETAADGDLFPVLVSLSRAQG